MKIDKTDWKTYKLIDVLTKKEENDRENAHSRFDRFLKVNHMDAESLHIKRWASQKEGEEINPTFYKIFRKGQILFPTRNPHLRRTVLASFDGICGEKTLTLEANNDLILPEFVPFLFHSDNFYAHTTGAIIGSTNPHCRWRDVANYEFLLPPKDQQAQLAKLLWAMDEVIEKEKIILGSTEILRDVKLKEYFEFSNDRIADDTNYFKTEIGWLPNGYELTEQGQVANFINGRAYKKNEWETAGVPVIRLQNLTGTGENYYYSNLELPEKNYCNNGDLLYMWSATFGARIWDGGKAIFHYHIWKIDCDDSKLRQQYMFYNLEEITKRMMLQVSGSTMPHITKAGMDKLKIGLPPISIQDEITYILEKVSNNILSIEEKLKASRNLQKSLINQIF